MQSRRLKPPRYITWWTSSHTMTQSLIALPHGFALYINLFYVVLCTILIPSTYKRLSRSFSFSIMGDSAIGRKSSIESEPRTLRFNQIQYARVNIYIYLLLIPSSFLLLFWVLYVVEFDDHGVRWFGLQEVAEFVMNTNSIEEAKRIFTKVFPTIKSFHI